MRGRKGNSSTRSLTAASTGKKAWLPAVMLAAIMAVAPATAAATPLGALTQTHGPSGCIDNGGGSECLGNERASGLGDGSGEAISPDGHNLYVVSTHNSDVVSFSVGPDGTLTELPGPAGCLAESGTATAGCSATATGLAGATAVTVSPDGRNVYVVATQTSSGFAVDGDIAEFSRDPQTGALTQLPGANDCIAQQGSSEPCGTTGAQGLLQPLDLAISPDGANVYVADGSTGLGAISEFTRDPVTGALSQLPVPDDCISADGGGCGSTGAVGLGSPARIVVSPDGADVYTATDTSDAAIAAFSRRAGGALRELPGAEGCVGGAPASSSGADGCPYGNGHGFSFISGLVISPDGRNVYSLGSGTIGELSRNGDGSLTQMASPNDCLVAHDAPSSSCGNQTGHGFLSLTGGLAISPDGASVYAATSLGTSYPSPEADAILELARGADGGLAELPTPDNCIEEENAGATEFPPPPDCGTTGGIGMQVLRAPDALSDGLVVAPNGLMVYAASGDAVAELARTPSPSALGVPPGGTGAGGLAGGSDAASPSGSRTGSPSRPGGALTSVLDCGARRLMFTDVALAGARVRFSGAAPPALAGKRVQIVLDGRTVVASPRVRADGLFSATAPAPPTRKRLTARYQARAGRLVSAVVTLSQRVIAAPPRLAHGRITLTGEVLAPLTEPITPIVVMASAACSAAQRVATVSVSPRGRFTLTLSAPAGVGAALYQFVTRVRSSSASRRTALVRSLPVLVALR